MKKPKKTYQEKQQEKIIWLISEYDCYSLEGLLNKAKNDPILNRLLRECGIKL